MAPTGFVHGERDVAARGGLWTAPSNLSAHAGVGEDAVDAELVDFDGGLLLAYDLSEAWR